jgi:periplasmic protein TonB
MRDPLSRSFGGVQSSQDSWLQRVRDNFQQFLTPTRTFPSSANGAPLHLLSISRTAAASRARTVSLLTHAGLVAGILLLNFSPHVTGIPRPLHETVSHGGLTFSFPPDDSQFGRPSLGKKGGGGEDDPRPARRGLLVPASSIPLAPPRRLTDAEAVLPVSMAVFDANAPEFAAPMTNLGIPWMKKDSDSAGPGKRHGFGAGHDGGMGDDEGADAGQGVSYGGPYANIASLPRCAYCPDPQYTDEAREAKMQGTVTLQVLVNAEGRASQIRIVKGIGMGLDERAREAIRGWKFVPAHDGARRAVPAWVTVEAIFRLF